jgi:hypothetical protein
MKSDLLCPSFMAVAMTKPLCNPAPLLPHFFIYIYFFFFLKKFLNWRSLIAANFLPKVIIRKQDGTIFVAKYPGPAACTISVL